MNSKKKMKKNLRTELSNRHGLRQSGTQNGCRGDYDSGGKYCWSAFRRKICVLANDCRNWVMMLQWKAVLGNGVG
jgi:hypothetical protein